MQSKKEKTHAPLNCSKKRASLSSDQCSLRPQYRFIIVNALKKKTGLLACCGKIWRGENSRESHRGVRPDTASDTTLSCQYIFLQPRLNHKPIESRCRPFTHYCGLGRHTQKQTRDRTHTHKIKVITALGLIRATNKHQLKERQRDRQRYRGMVKLQWEKGPRTVSLYKGASRALIHFLLLHRQQSLLLGLERAGPHFLCKHWPQSGVQRLEWRIASLKMVSTIFSSVGVLPATITCPPHSLSPSVQPSALLLWEPCIDIMKSFKEMKSLKYPFTHPYLASFPVYT